MGTVKDKLNLLLSTKAAIKNAIISKGQAIADTDPFSSYAAKITAIQTGVDTSDATATAGDILSGKEAYVNGEKVTGTIAGRTASDLTSSGATVTVPAGYYASQATKSVATATQATPSISVDSAGKITASATQSAGYVAAGTKSATKQLTAQAATTITPGTAAKTAVAAGRYTTGAVKVAGDTNLKAENIKKGISIFNVTGIYEPSGPLEPTDSSSVTIKDSGGFTIPITVIYPSSASQISTTNAKTFTTFGAFYLFGSNISISSISGGTYDGSVGNYLVLPTSSSVSFTVKLEMTELT